LTLFSQIVIQTSSKIELVDDEIFYARIKQLDILSIDQTDNDSIKIRLSAEMEYWNLAKSNVTIGYPTYSDHLLDAEYFGEENVTVMIPTGSVLQVMMGVKYPPGLSTATYEAVMYIDAEEEIDTIPNGDYHVIPWHGYPEFTSFGVNISVSEEGNEMNYDPILDTWPEEETDNTPVTIPPVTIDEPEFEPEFHARIIALKLSSPTFYSSEYSEGYTIEITAKVDYWNKNQDPINVMYAMICPVRLYANYSGAENPVVTAASGLCMSAVTREEYPTGLSTKTFDSTIYIRTNEETDHIPYGSYRLLPELGGVEGGMVRYGVKIIISEDGTTLEYEIPDEWPETDPINSLSFSLILPAIAVLIVIKRRRK
jgi:hypothetical protein